MKSAYFEVAARLLHCGASSGHAGHAAEEVTRNLSSRMRCAALVASRYGSTADTIGAGALVFNQRFSTLTPDHARDCQRAA